MPWIPTLEIKISQGWIKSIDVVAEIPLLHECVLHCPGRGGLGQQLPPAAGGALRRHWRILRDAGLSSEFTLSLPRRKKGLRVG